MEKGRNAGVTGDVDVGGTKFAVRVGRWRMSGRSGSIKNTGEGSAGIEQSRGGNDTGGLILTGKVQSAHYPVSKNLRFANISLVVQMDKGKTVTESLRVEAYTIEFSEKTEDTWDIELVCTRNAAPVFAGFGAAAQYDPSAPAAGERYLYAGRGKVYDPIGIVDSSTQVVDFWGLATDSDAGELTRLATIISTFNTPPQSGQTLYSAQVARTDYAGGRVVLTWRRLNSGEQLEIGGTHSFRSSNRFQDVVAELVSSAVSDSAEANTQFVALQSDPTLEGIQVHSVNKAKKLVVVEYLDVGTRIVGATSAGPRYVPAIDNSGTIQVYLESVKIISGSQRLARHRSVQLKTRPVRYFSIYQQVSQPPPIPDQASLEGHTNNSTFLGLAAGTVRYLGCHFDVNVGLSGNIPMLLRYDFEADSAGVFDYIGVVDDYFITTASAVAGFNNASIFSTEKTIVVTAATQSDFSVFT